jgi:hypothetical protein
MRAAVVCMYVRQNDFHYGIILLFAYIICIVSITITLTFKMITCVGVPVLKYRFPTVIDIFPIEIFCSRYTVITNSFSDPTIRFPLPFPVKKFSNGNG